jgi:glucose-1-phosphate thymidylyltransferase
MVCPQGTKIMMKQLDTESTDINKAYMHKDELQMVKLGRGFAWLDTGTHDSLLQASHFVETIEKRQGYKIACLEEIAYRLGYINSATLEKNIAAYGKSQYADYLKEFCANY